MNYKIREIRESEYPILSDFLYEAIFIPERMEKPPKSIIRQPALQVYIVDFGKADDWCLVAEVKEKIVGAVWVRIMNDYGHIDDEMPSFAISLYDEYRNLGIGTALMRAMLQFLKDKGYNLTSLEWIEQFINKAVEMKLDEIRLLEHCYIFEEFMSMYDSVCAYSKYVDDWFRRSAGKHKMSEYCELIEKVRKQKYPVKIKFGLEICYFKEYETFIGEMTKYKGFDFLLGSIHFHWQKVNYLMVLVIRMQ